MESSSPDPKVLEDIQQRVLWLATRIVDAANHERDTGDGVKVGGHQASSASLVTRHDRALLRPPGRRRPGQRQAARLPGVPRDPVPARQPRPVLPDRRCARSAACSPTRAGPRTRTVSTSPPARWASGAAAPLFAAATRRYVDAHFGARPRSRFIALIGDAELDEGNIWEAVADPATDGLGNVLWIVDVNRQSLDRVVPGVRIAQWEQQFSAAGWHVVEAKYGRRCRRRSASPGGDSLRDWIDAMPNEQYQSLFGLEPAAVRERFLRRRAAGRDQEFCAGIADDELATAGHRPGRARPRLAAGRVRRVRRREGPAERAVRLHDQGLGPADRRQPAQSLRAADHRARSASCRERLGLTEATEWDRLDPMTPAGQWAAARREHLARAAAAITGAGHGRQSSRMPPACARPGRSPPRRRSAGSWSTCPGPSRWRRTWSRPLRTWRPRPTWPASSTGPASSARRRGARGARTRCSSGPRARTASTSSSASAR